MVQPVAVPNVRPTITLRETRVRVVGLSCTESDLRRMKIIRGDHLFQLPEASLALQIFRIGLACVEDEAARHAVSQELRERKTLKGT